MFALSAGWSAINSLAIVDSVQQRIYIVIRDPAFLVVSCCNGNLLSPFMCVSVFHLLFNRVGRESPEDLDTVALQWLLIIFACLWQLVDQVVRSLHHRRAHSFFVRGGSAAGGGAPTGSMAYEAASSSKAFLARPFLSAFNISTKPERYHHQLTVAFSYS